ncbi:uncharacterized protein L3040_006777 [Drepanopeziza brunnea f. sp. 'multigermtubi']|nr:hypothetical protein L3040_006777 [Drepanopeziza brunnea f. sp. 'multigermtubi']
MKFAAAAAPTRTTRRRSTLRWHTTESARAQALAVRGDASAKSAAAATGERRHEQQRGRGSRGGTADGEEEGLGRVRFASAAAQPARVAAEFADVPIEGEEEIEVGDQQKFSETELKLLCQREADEQIRAAYTRVAGFPCHGETGPRVERLWKLPTRSGGCQARGWRSYRLRGRAGGMEND